MPDEKGEEVKPEPEPEKEKEEKKALVPTPTLTDSDWKNAFGFKTTEKAEVTAFKKAIAETFTF